MREEIKGRERGGGDWKGGRGSERGKKIIKGDDPLLEAQISNNTWQGLFHTISSEIIRSNLSTPDSLKFLLSQRSSPPHRTTRVHLDVEVPQGTWALREAVTRPPLPAPLIAPSGARDPLSTFK